MKKVFVDVTAIFTKEGAVLPVEIIWEDGRKYTVDKIFDCKQAASLKVGGQGKRYRVRIQNKEVYLFYEDTGEVRRWFMEGK